MQIVFYISGALFVVFQIIEIVLYYFTEGGD